MDKPHYNVVIATPGSSMKAAYVQSLMRTTEWLNVQQLTYIYLNKQSSLVSTARERTATNTDNSNWNTSEIGSGEFTYDKIVWIDSDMEWTVSDFETLLRSDLDIVSGLCLTGPDGFVGAHFPDENGLPTRIHKDELLLQFEPVEVGGAGFAFIAMKSGVFETVERPWFLMRRIKWPDVEFYTMVGEDFSWCAAAQKAGYKIYLDPSVKPGHHKECIFIA